MRGVLERGAAGDEDGGVEEDEGSREVGKQGIGESVGWEGSREVEVEVVGVVVVGTVRIAVHSYLGSRLGGFVVVLASELAVALDTCDYSRLLLIHLLHRLVGLLAKRFISPMCLLVLS